jgi:integrase
VRRLRLSDSVRLTNRTINKYVVALSNVFKWARRSGKFDGENPFEGQSRPKADPKKIGWLPYTIEELNRLFGSEVFKGMFDERTHPAHHTMRTALQWIPLIALFSGMRQGEICQLRKHDVRAEHGIWFFDVTEQAENQSVKTVAGVRKVPVHSEIMRCGFPDYVKALPDGQLFRALRPGGPDGKLSWYFSRRYVEFRRSVGIDRKRISFHSFRKNVATTLDNAGANRGDIAALIGHERGFTLDVYSGGKELPALKKIVELIRYDGLELSHLYIKK